MVCQRPASSDGGAEHGELHVLVERPGSRACVLRGEDRPVAAAPRPEQQSRKATAKAKARITSSVTLMQIPQRRPCSCLRRPCVRR